VSWTNDQASHFLSCPAELDMQVPIAGTNRLSFSQTRGPGTALAWETEGERSDFPAKSCTCSGQKQQRVLACIR
jgi:hypothetical protein